MEIFLITVVIMLVATLGLAVGVMIGRKELKGSCGGLGNVMGEACQFCDKKNQCTDTQKKDCTGEHFTPLNTI